MCLAAHKLLLLKSCYEECLSCVITILVVCISAPLAIKPAPDTVPSMVLLSKNMPLGKQSNHFFFCIGHFSIKPQESKFDISRLAIDIPIFNAVFRKKQCIVDRSIPTAVDFSTTVLIPTQHKVLSIATVQHPYLPI